MWKDFKRFAPNVKKLKVKNQIHKCFNNCETKSEKTHKYILEFLFGDIR